MSNEMKGKTLVISGGTKGIENNVFISLHKMVLM